MTREISGLGLQENEYIVTAFACRASGPGWSNAPVVVVVFNRALNSYREVYIHPKAQTSAMLDMYRVAENATVVLVREAEKVLTPRRRNPKGGTR